MDNKLVILRCLAISMVVLGHSIIIYDPLWVEWTKISSSEKALLFVFLKRVIDVVQMPLFFALSGYVFYFTVRKTKNLFWLVRNKFSRLLIPFIFVGVFYRIPILLMLGVPEEILSKKGVLVDFITGRCVGHLWFLPTLFFIMLVFFVLLPKRRNTLLDALMLLVVVLFAELPRLISLPLPYYSFFCTNSYGFVLGYMIHKYSFLLESRRTLVVCLSVLVATIVLMVYHIPLSREVSACTLVCMVFRCMPVLESPIVKAISKNSYGLYLFHSPLICFTFMLCPNIHPFWMLVINFGVCGIIAFMLTELVRKAHLGWIIGESNMRK